MARKKTRAGVKETNAGKRTDRCYVCEGIDEEMWNTSSAILGLDRDPKNYTKYYRHLLAYPSRIYSELGESAKIFLIGSFSKRGEITEQFGAYQEIALNKGILDAANILYWDETTKNLKRSAAGKGGGSARRLVRIIRQYQLTYDLNSMNGNQIASMLPANEFSKWTNTQ